MDDFRTIVKNFEKLEDRMQREKAETACVSLAKQSFRLDRELVRKMREFVDDHLAPAKFENLGSQLATRQQSIQSALERVLALAEASGQRASTMPIRQHVGQQQDSPETATTATSSPHMASPTALVAPPVLSQVQGQGQGGGNSIFHTFRSADPSPTTTTTYPSPTTAFSSYMSPYPQQHSAPAGNKQGPSQLERMYTWGGGQAVRRLLALDGEEMADSRRVRKKKLTFMEKGDEMVCQRASEMFGGVWIAAK